MTIREQNKPNTKKSMQTIKKSNGWKSAMATLMQKKNKKYPLTLWCIVLMGKQSVKQYLTRTVAVYSSYLWFA